MQLKKLFNDDAAVSPVIGVILMVAITVILAAVIGTFVLGLGDSIGENAPSASYDWDEGAEDVSLTHQSGQNIDAARLSVSVNGTTITGEEKFNETSSFGEAWAGDDGSVSSGDRVTFTGDATELGEVEVDNPTDSGTDYRVIWTASGGDSSSTLTTFTVN